MASDAPPVRTALERVWREVMPNAPFDLSLTWEDAGADSLELVRMLMALEDVLGQPISFDLTTIDQPISRLLTALSPSSEQPQAKQIGPKLLPTIFLLPGVFGDEPVLAEFRRFFADDIHFETLRLPDLEASAPLLSDLQATSALIAAAINERQPSGAIKLAGYSFGGFAAFDAAQILVAQGRRVDLVCLLDSHIERSFSKPIDVQVEPKSEAPSKAARWGRVRALVSDPQTTLENAVYQRTFDHGMLEVARRVAVRGAPRLSPDGRLARRRQLLWALRKRAMQSWRSTPCNFPVLLVNSDQFVSEGGAGVWETCCTDLTVEHVGGAHDEVFHRSALEQLAPALRLAVMVGEELHPPG